MNQNRQKDEKGKLFIGRLSWETQSDTLLNYFSRYGEVIDCVVMKNKETGCSRGFGFVTYKDPECVHLILSGGPHIIDGRQVDPKACNPRTPYKVSETKPQSTSSDENQSRKIFVGGLPFDVDEGILIDFFSRYGKVKEASIMYDLQKGRSRGFGFLTFDSEDSVDEVCKEHFVTINGKQVECKRAEPLSRGKMTPNDNNGGGGGVNNNYFMQSPPPPPMPYHMQHPPPAMDHRPTGPPGPGMEMWRPPHESGNGDNRKEMNPENGDGIRQPYPTNGPPTSIYQPVSYPGIYSVAQQQQIHQQQQQQQQQQQLPQPATPMQQPTAAGQAYSLPPMYPNFSSPPLSAQQQQQPPPQDYMALWNQPAPVDSSGQAVASDGGKWSGVPPPPPHLLAAQTQPTQQTQQQQLQQTQQQQQQPAQQNSSYNIPNQISLPSALPTVYPGLSPLGQMKIPPNFANAPQTQVQQTASSSMPYSNYGFAENENGNFAAGAPAAAAGNGHIMMFADASGQPPGQNYNQRQPIAQTFHPYRR